MNRQWIVTLSYSLLLCMSQSVFLLATSLRIVDLGYDEIAEGQAGTAFGLTYAIVAIFGGILGDRIGRTTVMVASYVISAVACVGIITAEEIEVLILWVACFAAGNAGVWPAFEAWVADRAHGALARGMGAYNLGWASGAGIGFLFAALTKGFGSARSYELSAGLNLLLAVVLVAMDKYRREPASSTENEQKPNRQPTAPERIEALGRLRSVWMANSAMWFSWSVMNWIFPRQARAIGLDDSAVGLVLATVTWTEVVMFLVLSWYPKWHLSARLRMAFQCAACVGFGLFATGFTVRSVPSVVTLSLFILAAAAFGAGLATTYAASLVVSVSDRHRRGTRSGVHETLIGIATVFGPLLAGHVAVHFGDWATYVVSIAVLMVAIIGQACIALSIRRQYR